MIPENLTGKIIQCHIDSEDPDTFVVGRLAWADTKWFLMQDLSSAGQWNGLALYLVSDIVLIEEDTPYIQKMETLLKFWDMTPPVVPEIGKNAVEDMLLYGKASGKIVGLELCCSGYRDVNGFVNGLSHSVLSIKQIDEFGRDDGESCLSVEAITRCYLDDIESQCLEVLANGFRQKEL